MALVYNEQPDTIFAPTKYVSIKTRWTDEWTWVPYCSPIESTKTLISETGSASFQYNFGIIGQPGEVAYKLWSYIGAANCYIKIDLYAPGYGWIPDWIGKVDHESVESFGVQYPSGVQTFTAHTLDSILAGIPVLGSFFWAGGTLCYNDSSIEFNGQKHRRTVSDLNKGNRSTVKLFDGGPYYFYEAMEGDTDPGIWTKLDALQYLLSFYANDYTGTLGLTGQPQWKLCGLTRLLDDLIFEDELDGSVLEGVQKLIDVRRGLYGRVVTDGVGPIYIVIGSMFLGENFETLQVTNSDRRIQSLKIDIPHQENHNQIWVLGGNVYMCCSFTTYADLFAYYGPMVKGWSDIQETAYKALSLGSKEKNDAAWTSEKEWGKVYQSFVVDPTWDGLINGFNCVPSTDYSGNLDYDVPTAIFAGQMSIETEIPFQEEGGESGMPRERLRTPFAVAWTILDGGTTGAFQYVEKIKLMPAGQSSQIHAPGSFDVPRKGWGITVRCTPPHLAALDSFDASAVSNHNAAWDWRQMICTLMFKLPCLLKCRVVIQNGTAYSETPRAKIIQDRDAKVVVIAPGTVTDINVTDPTQLVTTESVTLFRDDRQRIISEAYRCALWYGQQMSSISMMGEGIDACWYPGILVAGVLDGAGFTPVGTIVVSVHQDYENNTTSIHTSRKDWQERNSENTEFVNRARKESPTDAALRKERELIEGVMQRDADQTARQIAQERAGVASALAAERQANAIPPERIFTPIYPG